MDDSTHGRRFRRSILLCKAGPLAALLVVFFGLAAPAHAVGFCDRFSETLSDTEQRNLAVQIRLPLPALYALRLSKVRVENNPDGNEAVPRVRVSPSPSDPTVILMPIGFQRLSCKLVQVNTAYSTGAIKSDGSAKDALKTCVATGRRRADCLTAMLDAEIAKIAPAVTGAAGYDDKLRSSADAAFRFVLEHEAGHILFADNEDSVADGLDLETAADLLAFLALSASSDDVTTPIGLFSTWSVVDDTIDWTKENHPTFGCRSLATYYMWREIVPSIYLVHEFIYDTDEYISAEAAAAREAPMSLPSDGEQCWKATVPQVARVRADLDAVVAAIDQAVAVRKDGPAALARLVAVRPATQQIRGLRDMMIASWTRSYIQNSVENVVKGDNDIDSVGAMNRTLTKIRRNANRMLDTVDREIDGRLMSSQIYGVAVADNEMLRMSLAGSLQEERIAGKIALVKRYSPGSAYIPYLSGIIQLKRQNCRAARILFAQAEKIDPSFSDMTRKLLYDEDEEEDDDQGQSASRCPRIAKYL